MHPRTAIVALDLRPHLNVGEYMKFDALPFEKKLELYCQKIEKACAELADKEKDAKAWIITWREDGLKEADSPYLTREHCTELKNAMKEITKKYGKLTIISGAAATRRMISPTSYRKEMLKVIEGYTATKNLNMDPHYKKHHIQAQSNIRAILAAKDAPLNTGVVRMTSYVFNGGELVARHDKTAPYSELHNMSESPDLFRPGRQKSHSSILSDQAAIKEFGIEICYEHKIGVLQAQCKKEQKPAPHLQFVLSNTVTLAPENIVSPYLVHVDSRHHVLLVTEIDPDKTDITLYRMNAIEAEAALESVPPCTVKQALAKGLELNIKYGTPTTANILKYDLDVTECEKFILLLINKSLTKDYDKMNVPDTSINLAEYLRLQAKMIILYAQKHRMTIDPRVSLLLETDITSPRCKKLLGEINFSVPHQTDNALLCLATRNGNSDLLLTLLDKGMKFSSTEMDKVDFDTLYNMLKSQMPKNPLLANRTLTVENETLLHLAVKKSDAHTVTSLLEDPCIFQKINQQDAGGCTALHLAAANDNHIIIPWLLNAGADPTLRTSQGESAIDIALRPSTAKKTSEMILSGLRYQKLTLLDLTLQQLGTGLPSQLQELAKNIHSVVLAKYDLQKLDDLVKTVGMMEHSPQMFATVDSAMLKLNKLIKEMEDIKISPEDFKTKISAFMGGLAQPDTTAQLDTNHGPQ
jgi:hypothetical protein